MPLSYPIAGVAAAKTAAEAARDVAIAQAEIATTQAGLASADAADAADGATAAGVSAADALTSETNAAASEAAAATYASTAETIAASVSGGVVAYTSLALMNADVSQPNGTQADNYEDGNRYRFTTTGNLWVLRGPSSDTGLLAIEADAPSKRTLNGLLRDFINYTAAAISTANTAASTTTGLPVTATGRFLSGWVRVTPTMRIVRWGAEITSGSFAPIAFYSATKVFLGFAYTAGSNNVWTYDISSAPAGTAWVRFTASSSVVEYYVHEPKALETLRESIFSSSLGAPVDRIGRVTNQYFNKTTGVDANSSAFRMTGKLLVGPNSWIATTGGTISSITASQAQIGFFGPDSVKTVSAITQAAQGVATIAGHGFVAGQKITFSVPTADGMVQLHDAEIAIVSVGDANTVTLDVDTTAYAAFVNSGTATATGNPYLGHYNSRAVGQPIRVGDLYPTAKFVRFAFRTADVGAVYVTQENPTYDAGIREVLSAARVDWLSEALRVPGRIDSDGSITQPTSDVWRTTPFVPVIPGQVFHYSVTDATGTGPSVAGYDANKSYIGPILFLTTGLDRIEEEITIPATLGPDAKVPAFIRAMARIDLPPYGLTSARAASAAEEVVASAAVSFFNPEVAYGRIQDGEAEPIYIYKAGILADRAVPINYNPVDPSAFAEFRGDDILRIVPEAAGEQVISARATVGSGDTAIGNILVRVTDFDALEDPEIPLNILGPVGDSTISQLANDANSIDGDHTTGNEMGRQLTGEGDPALPYPSTGESELADGTEWGPVVAADSRPAGTLSNIYVRGLRGLGALKGFGFGGWHWSSFLDRPNYFDLHLSADFVSGNVIEGRMSDGVTPRDITPVSWQGSHEATLAALAAAIQTTLRLYGVGTNPPTAVVDGTRDIRVTPKWNVDLDTTVSPTPSPYRFRVTGGSVQPVFTNPGDGKVNPFYDPNLTGYGPNSDYRFSPKFAIETYDWDYDESLRPTGVRADGSNLIVPFCCVWNDYGDNTEAGVSAGHLAYVLDQLHTEYPQALALVMGAWAPPNVNIFKNNIASIPKWYGPSDIFNEAVRAYGTAYRNTCNSEDRLGDCVFLPIAHQSNPATAYSRVTFPSGRRANHESLHMIGYGDFVHKRRRGYADNADILTDAIAWHAVERGMIGIAS